MPVGQALAVAFGLVFAILGGMYVMARSQQEAEQRRATPGGPRSKIWWFVDRGFTLVLAGIWFSVGTWFLIHRQPNVFIAAGLATLVYAHALKHAFGLSLPVLRAALSAYVLAGVLGGVGAALYGGAVGILGATGSFVWTITWLWIVRQLRGVRSDADNRVADE